MKKVVITGFIAYSLMAIIFFHLLWDSLLFRYQFSEITSVKITLGYSTGSLLAIGGVCTITAIIIFIRRLFRSDKQIYDY